MPSRRPGATLLTRLASLLLLLAAVLGISRLPAPAAAATSAATHDGLRQLTSSNFTLTQNGAWLIEFFSPSCIHCKKFGPTWSELSQNKDHLRTQYPEAPFTLAQVNCIAQRDLCTEQGVEFLPRLTIYQDGVQHQGEYKGDRNYAEIAAYIDKHAAEYRAKKGIADKQSASVVEANKGAAAAVPAPAAAAAAPPPQSQQQPAAAAVPPASPPPPPAAAGLPIQPTTAPPDEQLPAGPNPKGELISYGGSEIPTPEALAQWLGKGSGQGPTFVKFFAPWCPHCKNMAAAFKQVAASLKGHVNVLEVDCVAHGAICTKYKVNGYPTLRMYNDGNPIEYNGGRNHDAMLQWASKAGAAVGMRNLDSVAALTKAAKADEVFFLYLHSPATTKREIDIVDRATRVLAGSPASAYVSSDTGLLERYAEFLATDSSRTVPASSALLVFKDHSTIQPTAAYHPSSSVSSSMSVEDAVEDVTKWVHTERWPLMTELTGANFDEVLDNESGAYVVVAALSDVHHHGRQSTDVVEGTKERDRELMAVRSLSLGWRENLAAKSPAKVIWAWIDADRWATQLRKLYGIKPLDLPHLLLVNGAREEYYELPSQRPDGFGTWTPRERVYETIAGAVRGELPAKSSRSMLDRGIRGAAAGTGAVIDTSKQHPLSSFAFVAFFMAVLFWGLRRASAESGGALGSSLPLYNGKAAAGVKAD
ncbi:related to Pig2 - related to protein disulfide isomerase [Pseudozyma flocculosa]|nr:related to Pig2 - related to protein disulfide isomerase [Pseudozyma flocculosa]